MVKLTNTDRFAEGAYLLNSQKEQYIPFHKGGPVFLTQVENTGLKKEIIKLISEAKEVLKICSFIITDEEIFNTLLRIAKDGKVVIFILTQLDQNKLSNVNLIDILTEEEAAEKSSQVHLDFIRQLYHEGTHVRASVSAHAKFIIVDRKKGFITSANMTRPSLSINTESGVYLSEVDSIALDRLFDVIFQQGTHYRKFIDMKRYNKMVIVHSEVNLNTGLFPDTENSNLRFTFEQETNNLYEEIIHIVNGAETFLYLSTYSIVEIAKIEELYLALKAACERGVKVNVFCRGMNYRSDHLEGSQWLSSVGCIIYADMYNHSKGVINDRRGMLFTANIDGRHGLKNGFEVGVVLNEEQRIAFLEIQETLIKMAHYKYQPMVVRGELFKVVEEYEHIKGIIPPTMPAELTISSTQQIDMEVLETRILFFGRDKSHEYLIAGNNFYKCNFYDHVIYVNEKVSSRNDLEKYMLKYVNLTINPGL